MIKRLFQNKGIVTILAIAACIVILFFAYRYRVNSAIDAIDVPVASRSIEARTKITSDDIKVIKVAKSMLTNNVITSQSKIIDKYVNYNTFIPAGSFFYKSAVVDWKSMPDSTWADIPDCSTIISLSVNINTTYGNSIYPGDKIDLWFRGTADNKPFVGELIKGITVLAVKDVNGNHIFKKTANQANAAALIFTVEENFIDGETLEVENLHLLLRKALVASGEVFPVPRNLNYNPKERVSSKKIRDYIDSTVGNYTEDEIDTRCTDILTSTTPTE